MDLVRSEPPDVTVIDLRMPPDFASEGLEAADEIRAIAPGVGLLLLSQHVEAHHALRLTTEFDGGSGLPAEGPGLRPRGLRCRRAVASAVRAMLRFLRG